MAHFDLAIFNPERAKAQLAVGRYICAPYYRLFHRLEVFGRENLPSSGPMVVVGNHLSHRDPPLLVVACDRPMAYMAKAELFDQPGLSSLIKFLCAIPVKRDRPEKSTFKAVRHILSQGWSIGMFIEGTRSKTPGRMGLPHLGPAYFAKANAAPILPVGIIGTDKAFGKVIVRIGNLIEPLPDLEATTWQTMEALSQLSGQALPEHKLSTLS